MRRHTIAIAAALLLVASIAWARGWPNQGGVGVGFPPFDCFADAESLQYQIGVGWLCGDDDGGVGATPLALDIGNDGAPFQSNDLLEIAITGDTNAVFTESVVEVDTLLVDLTKDWPKADQCDVALTGDSATAFFSAGAFADARVDGSLEADEMDDDVLPFDDPDGNWTAAALGPALAELDDTNGSGPNAADGKVNWTQLVSVPGSYAAGEGEVVKYAKNYAGADLGAKITAAVDAAPLDVPILIDADATITTTAALDRAGTVIRCTRPNITLTRGAEVSMFNITAADVMIDGCTLDGATIYTAPMVALSSEPVRPWIGENQYKRGIPFLNPAKALRGEANVKKHFGCVGDNSTDDSECLTWLDTTIYPVTGQDIYFPRGDYKTTVGIRTGQDNRLHAVGRNSAWIRAAVGYTAATPMVTIACPNPTDCHGGMLEWIGLHGQDLAEVGLYSEKAQEAAGAWGAQFYGFTKHGIWMNNGAGVVSQNYTLAYIEGVPSNSMVDGPYVLIEGGGDPPRELGPFSITLGPTGTGKDCISIHTVGSFIHGVHCELKGRAVNLTEFGISVADIDHRGTGAAGGEFCSVEMTGLGWVRNVHRPGGEDGCLLKDTAWNEVYYNSATPASGKNGKAIDWIIGWNSGAKGHNSVMINPTGNTESPYYERFYRPAFTDSATYIPRTAPPTCNSNAEGTSYYDSDLSLMCVCSNRSLTYRYESLDGGATAAGNATSCSP